MTRGKPSRTLYVVAYDISSDRRRTKVHKTLCGFGKWTQYSLFECHLTEKELVALRGRLDACRAVEGRFSLNGQRTCRRGHMDSD